MSITRDIKLIDNETGEIFETHSQMLGSKLGGGWIVVYKVPLQKLLKVVPNFATLKVYLYIASSQDFNKVTLISAKYISAELDMAYQTVWNSIKWLKQAGYIKDGEMAGMKGYVVNPTVSTCGVKKNDEKLKHFVDDIVEEEVDADRADQTEEEENDIEDDPTIEYGDFPIEGEGVVRVL